MIEFNHSEYGSSKGILAFPDHYVAVGVTHAKATVAVPGLAVLVGTRYIVKAGTIYPANDATAKGIVFSDVDVTNGDANMAIIVHGFVKTAALPAAPTANALTALKNIVFLPFLDFRTVSLKCTKLAVANAAETLDPATVKVTIEDGVFREEAGTLTNWTISGEDTTKLDVDEVALSADKLSVTFTLSASAAAAAGDVTVRPAATCIDINFQPAAVTIATVAAAG